MAFLDAFPVFAGHARCRITSRKGTTRCQEDRLECELSLPQVIKNPLAAAELRIATNVRDEGGSEAVEVIEIATSQHRLY